MKFAVDTDAAELTVTDDAGTRTLPLYSPEAFAVLGDCWVNTGWALKYSYQFSWLGRPIIQVPEDMFRMQEVIHATQPDVIVETGVAHGGSLIFYAGLCAAMGKGRVVGVDIEIRPHNRTAIEAHRLSEFITLIEGSSIAPDVVQQVRSLIRPGERVLVILDSNHSRGHVRDELEAYCDLVDDESWIVACDGVMGSLTKVPGGKPGWADDNPTVAAAQFVEAHPEFEVVQPKPIFDESPGLPVHTYWPGAWVRRKR